jgi:hypothetical protein
MMQRPGTLHSMRFMMQFPCLASNFRPDTLSMPPMPSRMWFDDAQKDFWPRDQADRRKKEDRMTSGWSKNATR